MTEDADKPKPDWRNFLRRARHVDGTTENYVDPLKAMQRQAEPQADIHNPANMLKLTPDGKGGFTKEPVRPIRGGRTQGRLQPIEGTEPIL